MNEIEVQINDGCFNQYTGNKTYVGDRFFHWYNSTLMQFNDDMDLPAWERHVPTVAPWRTPLTPSLRTKFALTAIAYPIICLWAIFSGEEPSTGPLWQSDDSHVYVSLLMSSPSFLMFLPIIAFSIIGMAVWCFRPSTSNLFVVRFALFTGALASAIFGCLLMYITFIIGPVLALVTIAATAILIWLAPWFIKKLKRFTIAGLLITTAVVAIFLVVFMNVPEFGEPLIELLFFSHFCIIASAPFVACLSFVRASVAAIHFNTLQGDHHGWHGGQRWKLTSIGVIAAWLGTFYLNWKMALDSMMVEYSKLPLQNPSNCFVCSAAAHGHQRIVRSKLQSGTLVNRQMQRLKLLEFALQFLLPNCHRKLRAVYNRIGPSIAKLCRKSHWTADVVYVGLKPIESVAFGLQKHLGITNDKLDQVYRMPE